MKLLDKYPPYSPDINPIENIWSYLKRKLSQEKINNLTELKQKLVYYWNRIPLRTCRNLCKSFDNRIDQLLLTKGNRIRPWHCKKKVSLTEAIVRKNKWKTSWNKRNPNDEIKNIVYNDESLKLIRSAHIKKLTKKAEMQIRKINEQLASKTTKITKNYNTEIKRKLDKMKKEHENNYRWAKLKKAQYDAELQKHLKEAENTAKTKLESELAGLRNYANDQKVVFETQLKECKLMEEEDISLFYQRLTNDRRKMLACDYKQEDQVPAVTNISTAIEECDLEDIPGKAIIKNKRKIKNRMTKILSSSLFKNHNNKFIS